MTADIATFWYTRHEGVTQGLPLTEDERRQFNEWFCVPENVRAYHDAVCRVFRVRQIARKQGYPQQLPVCPSG